MISSAVKIPWHILTFLIACQLFSDSIQAQNRDRSGYPYTALSKMLDCIAELSVHINIFGIEDACLRPSFDTFLIIMFNWLPKMHSARTNLYQCQADLRLAV